MSAQECTAAQKIQDGETMIPEKHVCLRCFDCGMREDFPQDGSVLRSHRTHDGISRCHLCQSAYTEHEEQEKKVNAAQKIQDAWRKWQESKDSCPICLKTIGEDSCKTKCGHRFCTGCLLKSVQRNGSCPLCRGELIEGQGVVEDQEDDENHEMGMSMFDGDELDAAAHYQFNLSDQDYENAVNESLDASYSYQRGYSEGIERGRREAQEEFQPRMREEIDIATQKAYDDGVVQGRSLASEDIRLLREEIKRLKQRNSRLREDLQFATQPTREVYVR